MKILAMLLTVGLLPTAANAADSDTADASLDRSVEILDTTVQPVSYSEPMQLPPASGSVYQPMQADNVVGCGHCSHSHHSGYVECRRSCENQSCCERHRNRNSWKRAHTTGDMYPHFPYRPRYGGYYYFRPYNYMNIYTHQSQIINMGGDPRNPYSVSMFGPIYEEFGASAPTLDVPAGSVRQLGSSLPKLEDLLKQP